VSNESETWRLTAFDFDYLTSVRVLNLIYSNNFENILSNAMFDMCSEATPISLRLLRSGSVGTWLLHSSYLHAKPTV